ncbi:lasso peptide biosynthesis B2 protein [Streptomyces fradiae]|uniref:lasso peptide biosynthesis B2 protein n=1 Tax=Streptomyces fradiae TaxID=1906 RepID=UPI0033CE91B1
MEAYSTVRTGTCPERLAAAAGLALALVLLRLPFRHTVRAARLARRLGRRELEAARAEALVGAVRHTARWWPGRAACMETSLGAVLAAALLGRRLDWHLGPGSPRRRSSTTPGPNCPATAPSVSTRTPDGTTTPPSRSDPRQRAAGCVSFTRPEQLSHTSAPSPSKE